MPTSEYLTPTFVGGWTTVLAVAGVAGYRYWKRRYLVVKQKGPAPYQPPRKDNRAKKQRQEAYNSSAQKAADEEPTPEPVQAASASSEKEKDADVDNKDFAKRMSSVKEGKKFLAKSGNDKKKRQKSVKQSRAAETADFEAAQEAPSAPSSTGSADADDDASPAVSPEIAPADPSGVNDMLEPAAAGPSVLRLTDTENQKRQVKPTKAPEKTETKKQRQNRKKAEERKAAREADEQERKVLLEKQRRGAREAAGVAAKDGSQFMAAVSGGKSAWESGGPNGKSTTSSEKPKETIQPLDTFEPLTAEPSGKDKSANKTAKLDDSWIASMPSEEEQMEMLKSEEDEWNTVPTKSSKKTKKATNTSQEVSTAPAQESNSGSEAKATTQAPARPTASTNGKSGKSAQSFGSFAALSTGDGQDEEEEWDV